MSNRVMNDASGSSVKKILGNPKITFVLGGPASGKGTQCAKLVEEFGYTHISTGDLMRAEIASGSTEGQEIAKIVAEGGLVPHETTVGVLVNALIANPAKNYLIDGFPRSVPQAEYFEQTVMECQTVLFFNVEEETCVARCMERAKGSNRSDDREDVIRNRLAVYSSESKPVVELYRKFGRVREVDGGRDLAEVWADTRKAMLPQVSFMIGPNASGKSSLSNQHCERTNMISIRFCQWLKDEGLADETDEELIVMQLIKRLSCEVAPRVLLVDFPQTEYQAKFFMRNCCEPKDVFMLQCSKDVCQERMIAVGADKPNYLPSALLSKKIKMYNEHCLTLKPYLKAATNLREINTEKTLDAAFKDLCKVVEAQVIHCRDGLSEQSKKAHQNIEENLVSQHGFKCIDVDELRECEERRGTELGRCLRMNKQPVDPEPMYVVEMIKRIIYSGCAGDDKFLLVNFPLSPEQASYFEKHCCCISAIIYASANKDDKCIEVPGNMAVANLDAVFQKEFRLKTMREWDSECFDKHMGQSIDWCFVVGKNMAGKTALANALAPMIRGKVISMAAHAEAAKKKLGNEEEPFEGEVPAEKVEECVLEEVNCDRTKGERWCYIFDGFTHKTATEFLAFANKEFKACKMYINASCSNATIVSRFKTKNEIEGDLGEEQQTEVADQAKAAETMLAEIEKVCPDALCRTIKTDVSLESLSSSLAKQFKPKVLIVNHEKRLSVDAQCANLATKYNMLYISVYQLIKQHCESNTEWGKKLEASRKSRDLSAAVVMAEGIKDEFDEAMYSAVHFDWKTVMLFLDFIVSTKRSTEEYILLEGLCNNDKMEKEEDRLQIRHMDELFSITRCIGEISGIATLSYKEEKDEDVKAEIVMEKFEEPEVEEVKVVEAAGEGEEGEEGEKAEAVVEEEGGDKKEKSWSPKDYAWTVTNRRSKNLATLYRDYSGACYESVCDKAVKFGEGSSDQISASLDEFCKNVCENPSTHRFQQVIFKD